MILSKIIPVILMCFISVSCANNESVVAEQFSNENFLHGMPSGWVQAYSTRKGNMGMKEFVPKGQSINNWEEMITTQIFFGGISKSSKQFSNEMRESWKSSCPGAIVYPGANGKENGYQFEFWQQFCGNNPLTNRPEVAFIKTIEGNDSFYVIQKAWKRTPTKEEVVTWTKFLKRAFVCDSRFSERKCPSVKN